LGRHKIVVLLLGVVALASSFWFLLDVLSTAVGRTRTLSAGDFEARFANFPKPGADAVFGYLSDNQPNDPRALFEYHLTQYVLAPAIIKPTANMDLVVMNYHSKDLDFRLLHANHLDPYQEYGNGIALCRRSRSRR
jgi:hypothetical protein